MKEEYLQELYNDPQYIADMEEEQKEYEAMILEFKENYNDKK